MPPILEEMRREGDFPIRILDEIHDQWEKTDPRDRQDLKERFKVRSQMLRAYEKAIHNAHEEVVMEALKAQRPA